MNCNSDSYEIAGCDLVRLLALAYTIGFEQKTRDEAFAQLDKTFETLFNFGVVTLKTNAEE